MEAGIKKKLKTATYSDLFWVQYFILRATPSAAGPLAPRNCHLGAGCLHFGTLGDNFGTSVAPSGIILAPPDHPGIPWEQQNGFELVVYTILCEFGLILGLDFESFLSTEACNVPVFLGCFQVFS